MSEAQAVFFDLDSTLLDNSGTRETVLNTCREIAALAEGMDLERLMTANGEVWQSFWPDVQDGWALGRIRTTDVVGETWRRTLAAVGLEDDEIARIAVEAHLRHESAAHRLYDDAIIVLEALVEAGTRLALITNGAADLQRAKLRHVGIEKYFDAVVVSAEVGLAKPDAAVFEIALNELAVAPALTWHVGDSLEHDVAGATGAGLNAVWLNRSGLQRTADDTSELVEIRTLTELLRHLRLGE